MDLLFEHEADLRSVETDLAAQAQQIRLSAQAQDRLFQRVLAGVGAARRRSRFPRLALVSAVAAAAVAAAVVGAWRVPAAQARALVAAAQATTPTTTDLAALHMISTDLQRTPTGQPCTMRVEVWWKAPGSWRLDRSGTCQAGTVTVGNGGTATLYDTATRGVVVSSAKEADILPTAQIDDILKSSWPQATARVAGHATIDGHPVTEVAVTPTFRHEFSGSWPGIYEGKTVLWIDPSTHLILKAEAYASNGTVWFSSEPQTVDYNPSVTAAALQFTPPPGAHVINGAPATAPSVPWGPLPLSGARARASFPILAPADVPPGLQLVLQGALTGSVNSVTITGYDAAGRDVLDINEKPLASIDLSALPAAMRNGAAVHVDGTSGHQYSGAHVWWEADGMWVSVGSDSQVPGALSSADVMAVANSMSSAASPPMAMTAPVPQASRWKVWVPTKGPAGLPLGQGSLDAGRTLVQFTQTWSWPNPSYAETVVLREVPAPGLADGPIPAGMQVEGIGPWPATSGRVVKVGAVSATLFTVRPSGAPAALAQHVLTFVRGGTAIQITAQGIANADQTIIRLAADMTTRTASGATWVQ